MTKSMVTCALLTIGCVAKGGFGIGGPSSNGPGPSAAGGAPAAAQATSGSVATPDAQDFDPDAFYAITTTVAGKELALTFIPPPNLERGESIMNPKKSKIELRPLTNDPAQQWQFHPAGIVPKPSYVIYTKVSDVPDRLTGAMRLAGPDNRFIPTDAYRERHNRLTVGSYMNETPGYFYVERMRDGKVRIRNLLGHADSLNQPTEREWAEKWNEERALHAAGDGKLAHEKVADTPAQYWTVKKVGY